LFKEFLKKSIVLQFIQALQLNICAQGFSLTCINELSRKALQTSLRLSYGYFVVELNKAADL